MMLSDNFYRIGYDILKWMSILFVLALSSMSVYCSERRSLSIDGAEISYVEYGHGPDLILLHGGGLTGKMWKLQIDDLSKTYRVIIPDTRGHGFSTNTSERMSYQQLADDLLQFIEALKLKRPAVMGFSDGGIIAMTAAITDPSCCRALVLGGAAPLRTKAEFAHYFEGMKKFYGPLAQRQSLDDFDFSVLENDSSWSFFIQQHKKNDDPQAWKFLLRDVWPMWMTPKSYAYSDADIQTIVSPTLVVLGDRDDFFGVESAARFAKVLVKGELAVLPNTGHAAFKKSPKLFNEIVLDFLLKHE